MIVFGTVSSLLFLAALAAAVWDFWRYGLEDDYVNMSVSASGVVGLLVFGIGMGMGASFPDAVTAYAFATAVVYLCRGLWLGAR